MTRQSDNQDILNPTTVSMLQPLGFELAFVKNFMRRRSTTEPPSPDDMTTLEVYDKNSVTFQKRHNDPFSPNKREIFLLVYLKSAITQWDEQKYFER